MSNLPVIIQGGMGAGVSGWQLAQAVSRHGQLGVVSGTALDQILARRLQDGDPGGHMRRGLEHFPFRAMADRLLRAYYIPGGKAARDAYKSLPLHRQDGPRELQELCIAGNFIEVFLAREGHNHPVGINYLEKIQLPHLPSLYGALLGGVGYVLMGAGIPLKIPGVLDRLANHDSATYPLHVTGAHGGEEFQLSFNPAEFMEGDLPKLARPQFLAIIASNVLAATIVKRANGRVDGFVIEGPTAGGHNAPPRGKLQLNQSGDAIYGERDRVDLDKIRDLGLPFWLAGGYGTPEKLQEALASGATGIQVGTAFAYCEESGLRQDYKQAILQKVIDGQARVATSASASPTNFPFKVVKLEGTLSEEEVYAARPRICDLGFLRESYRTEEGKIDFRCSAEPVSVYISKGGNAEDTSEKRCLCNALMATVAHPQVRNGKLTESGLVTSGDELAKLGRFLPPDGGLTYTAGHVLEQLEAVLKD
jgi:nitronate monooxygenase